MIVPKKFPLELISTESEDRLDKKICPWDAIKMYEFDEARNFRHTFIDQKTSALLTADEQERDRIEKQQEELY
jgi:hypothetical protein